MTRKEILEIRKTFKTKDTALTSVCGCYVNHEKEIVSMTRDIFLALPEDEIYKYLDLFKKTLSGQKGKALFDRELSEEKENLLLALRNSKLKDDSLLEAFYNRVIANYDYPENYYILLVHGVYDVPGKASDGMEMYDASDDVFDHVLCCICPVNISKPGLSYNSQKRKVEDRTRDWVVQQPLNGFLYPAFNDRQTDIHNLLYYAKKEVKESFAEELCGKAPVDAKYQKTLFCGSIGEEVQDFESIISLTSELSEIRKEADAASEVELDEREVEHLLKKSGIDNPESISQEIKECLGNEKLTLGNLIGPQVEIKAPNFKVKIDSDRLDLADYKVIDGRKCLVLAADSLFVNDIDVHSI
ncbi:hypothetical protein M2146_001140 [Lachnospiraceae bacterium PF1-22]